jgi:hypothetical protein
MLLPDEVLHKMLAHPFFGRKDDAAFAQLIKHAKLPVLVGKPKRVGWEVKWE